MNAATESAICWTSILQKPGGARLSVLDRRQFLTVLAAMAGPRIALAQNDSSITVLRFQYLQGMGTLRVTTVNGSIEISA